MIRSPEIAAMRTKRLLSLAVTARKFCGKGTLSGGLVRMSGPATTQSSLRLVRKILTRRLDDFSAVTIRPSEREAIQTGLQQPVKLNRLEDASPQLWDGSQCPSCVNASTRCIPGFATKRMPVARETASEIGEPRTTKPGKTLTSSPCGGSFGLRPISRTNCPASSKRRTTNSVESAAKIASEVRASE